VVTIERKGCNLYTSIQIACMLVYMSERQIIRDIVRYSNQDEPMHHWAMVADGETVSELWVAIDTGEIMQVETPNGHQGNGYASALCLQAETEIAIYHAPESHRTHEGDRFARSVGGESLPCTHGCCTDEEE
jgi:hypothetical protein